MKQAALSVKSPCCEEQRRAERICSSSQELIGKATSMKHCQQARSHQASKAFTLVELLVVVSIIALLVAVLLPSLQKAREQARSVKCLANLHAYALAMMTYTAEHRDFLPGPVHPAIFRNPEQANATMGGNNAVKTLNWLLRRNFQVTNTSQSGQRVEVLQELSTCPTAALITRDQEFTGLVPAFSYAANSYGPLQCSNADNNKEWYHTDPPFYFGVWFWGDPFPAVSTAYNGRYWRPKPMSRLKRASDEWAFGDAWFRRVSAPGGGRVGSIQDRQFLGTFPSPQSGSPLPSAPYHSTSLSEVRTSKNLAAGTTALPKVDFKGKTNLGYFDGHAASFSGQWKNFGEGGTVHPYWQRFGGKNVNYDCP